MFLLNSRLGLFSAATLLWHSFSRSYGVILPSSLTRVLPFVLGFSPRPPVSVCGTGTFSPLRSFSRQREFNCLPYLFFCPHHSSALRCAYFTTHQPHCLDGVYHHSAQSILLCHCSLHLRWYRIINLLSIAYDFCPRLRSRLTLRGRAFLRKP